MQGSDLDAVLEIERASFRTPWSRAAFRHELERNPVARLWVAREPSGGSVAGEGPVVGYLCLWVVADEVHITNLAVRPDRRGQGIAHQLLVTLLARCRAQGATRAFLEVRPANRPARRLYEGLGFRVVGRRRGYYPDTGEDALLLEARLDASPGEAPPPRRTPGGTASRGGGLEK
jgi:ribosomal-protein-alanine N-acetyltransferase